MLARENLLEAIELEKTYRQWELSKYSTEELKQELKAREADNLYERKEDLDVTDGRIYDTKNEKYIED